MSWLVGSSFTFDEIRLQKNGALALASSPATIVVGKIVGDATAGASLHLSNGQSLSSVEAQASVTGSKIYSLSGSSLAANSGFIFRTSTLFSRGSLEGASLSFGAGGVFDILDGSSLSLTSLSFVETSSHAFVC